MVNSKRYFDRLTNNIPILSTRSSAHRSYKVRAQNNVQQSDVIWSVYEMSEKGYCLSRKYVWAKWKALTEASTNEDSVKESSVWL